MFWLHLAITAIYALVCWFAYKRILFYSGPIFALLLLFLINTSVKHYHNRNVYLMIRGDYLPPNRYKGETFVAVAIWLLSYFFPFLIEKLFQIPQGPIT
jgi:hypothetical protein